MCFFFIYLTCDFYLGPGGKVIKDTEKMPFKSSAAAAQKATDPYSPWAIMDNIWGQNVLWI